VRRWVFKLHSALALLALLPLLLIVLTGSLLVFKFEIDSLLMPSQVLVQPPGEARRLPQDELMARINRAQPDYELGSWELFDDGRTADRVYLIRRGSEQWFKAHLNPYSGELLDQPAGLHHALTDWLLNLHYTLLLDGRFESAPHLGLIVGLLAAICLSALGISGLILYRRFWRHFFSFRRDHRPMVVTRQLHRLLGIWSSPVLLLVGLTGLYFNAVAYLEESEEHTEGGHHIMQERLYNASLDFDALLADSRQQISGFEPTYLLFPFEPGQAFTVFGAVPGMNMLASEYGSAVSYDAHSGNVAAAYDLREQPLLARAVDSFRKLHFGHFAGLPSKIIWALGGLCMVAMPLTGVAMWYSRKRRQWTRRDTAVQPV
jgi:uncharacterized iron-regulated membrane protein